MLSLMQAPEGPTFNSHEMNGACRSPEGADQKTYFNVPKAETVGCGPLAPPRSSEEYPLFDVLFDDDLIRKNPRLASRTQVPTRD